MKTFEAAVIPEPEKILVTQRARHLADSFPDKAVRKDRLQRLLSMIKDNKSAIENTICEDFGHRSKDETLGFEILACVEEIRHTLKHFPKWMKTERRPVSLTSFPGRAEIVKQPLGVIGIVVPWNYPLYLAISPIVGALAAGNRVMIKMSEDTPRFGALFAEMVARTFKAEEVSVFTGDGRLFAALPFDHLLFTGSTVVGRQVMQAAAANLTPVTLELGGKSPAIIADDAAFESAIRKMMFGKLLNAGQTCIAPDYVLLPRGREQEFLTIAKQIVARFYPTLQDNPDYTCIINERQAQRLRRYIDDAKAQGAVIHPLHSEIPVEESRKFTPLIVSNVTDSMLIMQEEIFGPLLPLMLYDDVEQAIDYVNSHPRPLVLYLFSNDRLLQEKVLRQTTSGGVVMNDVIMQVVQNDLPFGGVGDSGMGRYHGKEGFDTFSNLKGVFHQRRMNGTFLLYPPRTGGRLRRLVEFLMR
ncbi:coniferyl aldehyde dehydrogenase [Glaciimonas sp. GG7]